MAGDQLWNTTFSPKFRKVEENSEIRHLGPVVQKPISANPGLKVNQGFNILV